MKNFFSNIYFYILAARPKTLTVGLSVVLCSLVLSWIEIKTLNWFLNGWIIFSFLTLQVAVNYFNDALDFKKKKDTSIRLGPPRMASSQKLSPKNLLFAALAMVIVSSFIGLYLALFYGGVFILIIGIIGVLTAYFYSAPVFSIADRGLSEIFVFLCFGVLPVLSIVYLNLMETSLAVSGILSFVDFFNFDFSLLKKLQPAILGGSQMGCLSLSVLIINHLRDQKEDSLTGKHTWVVRLGRHLGLIQWSISVLLAYSLGGYWAKSHLWVFLLPLFVLPLHLFIFIRIIKTPPSSAYNLYLALTALGQLLFAVAFIVGWIFFS